MNSIKKYAFIIFGGIGIVCILWYGYIVWSGIRAPLSVERVSIGGVEYTLEMANTDAVRAKGLSGRDELCLRCGMLFVFEQPGQYAFWMKDMRFPLDIVWLLGDTVVFVVPFVLPDATSVLNPDVVADRVIEVNASLLQDLHPGDRIRFLP